MTRITKEDVKKEICRVVWEELNLKEQGFSSWQQLLVKPDLDLFTDLGADEIVDRAKLHQTVEKRLRVHLLCREFEAAHTIEEITKAVCFKKGIK